MFTARRGDGPLTDDTTIDYGRLMHTALRGLVVGLLDTVARDGLPGQHHFFITFDTTHPDVDLPDWMHEKYPDEMTIVLQHSFENLTVDTDTFSVTLRFSEVPYTLVIPFDAVRTFVDPSVEFGLRFDSMAADEAVPEIPDDQPSEPETATETGAPGDSGVISLDAFRKT